MGNQAEIEDDLKTPQTPENEETPAGGAAADEPAEEPEGEPEEGGEGEPGDGQGEPAEDLIVREGDTQTPATAPEKWLGRRIGKLNGKVDKARAEADEFRGRNVQLEDENRTLKAALSQVQTQPPAQPLAVPNPEEFDGGAYDPAYIKAAQEYNSRFIAGEIQKGIAQATQQTSQTGVDQATARDLERQQVGHYERAAKLNVKDYEETEDKAIAIFGTEKTNHLIANLDKSELALYYFGKNEKQAEKFSDMLDKQPIKALLEMGALLAEIKVKKGGKSNPPDPDEELSGGSSLKPTKRGPKGATFE